MIYNMDDKLKFNEKPKIKINDKITVSVNNDAEDILRLMGAVAEKGELESSLDAIDILFSAEDRKKIKSLHLNIEDFTTLVYTAMALATGEDPDAEQGE